MNIELIAQCGLFSAFFSLVFVLILTSTSGLLWWLPKAYFVLPRLIQSVLFCEVCLGGWVAMLSYSIAKGQESIAISILSIILSGFVAMVTAKTIATQWTK